MKSYEDAIFDMEIPIDKNSKEFDLSLLEELKQLKGIPINKFDSLVRKIMRKKSSCKLWIDNKTVTERWDEKNIEEQIIDVALLLEKHTVVSV